MCARTASMRTDQAGRVTSALGAGSERVGRDPALVREIDLGDGARGTVVVDLLVGGRATGGVRVIEGQSPVEPAQLARVMTWKFALARIPSGGAKAVVSVPAGASSAARQLALDRLAASVTDLVGDGRWVPSPDLGVSAEQTARFLGLASGGARQARTSWTTSGQSTARSAVAAAAWALKASATSLTGARVALVGLGKVGLPLAELLIRRGARVVAVVSLEGGRWNDNGLSTGDLTADRLPTGAEPIDLDRLLALPVDALVLAATDGLVDARVAPLVGARYVVPATNVPVTPDAVAILAARRVVVLPACVCGAGGALGGLTDRIPGSRHLSGRLIETWTGVTLARGLRRAGDTRGLSGLAQATESWAEQRAGWMAKVFPDRR